MNVKSFEKLKCATAYFLQGQARWGAHFPEGGCSNVLPSSSAKGKRGGESSETQPLAHAGPWKIHTASLLCTERNFLPSWKFRLKPLKNWFQWDLEYISITTKKSLLIEGFCLAMWFLGGGAWTKGSAVVKSWGEDHSQIRLLRVVLLGHLQEDLLGDNFSREIFLKQSLPFMIFIKIR